MVTLKIIARYFFPCTVWASTHAWPAGASHLSMNNGVRSWCDSDSGLSVRGQRQAGSSCRHFMVNILVSMPYWRFSSALFRLFDVYCGIVFWRWDGPAVSAHTWSVSELMAPVVKQLVTGLVVGFLPKSVTCVSREDYVCKQMFTK